MNTLADIIIFISIHISTILPTILFISDNIHKIKIKYNFFLYETLRENFMKYLR